MWKATKEIHLLSFLFLIQLVNKIKKQTKKHFFGGKRKLSDKFFELGTYSILVKSRRIHFCCFSFDEPFLCENQLSNH